MEMTLKRAAELFARSLPRKPVDDDPDAAPIKIPWKRYVAIEDAVLELYRKADARTMPLDVFEIANSIGYAPVPYRLLGPVLYPVFMAASEDGVSMWWLGDKGGIFYNDRKPLLRQRFTIAHELGHVMLGHKEQQQSCRDGGRPFCSRGIVSTAPHVFVRHPGHARDIPHFPHQRRKCPFAASKPASLGRSG